MIQSPLRHFLLLWTLVTVAGCATHGPTPTRDTPDQASRSQPTRATALPAGDRVADIALDMVGTPYRFGGASPRGFDCSGLVYFAHDQVGIPVPRTTRAQQAAAREVRLSSLQRGDLLFFDTAWKAGHVGIYIGEGQFVHAPSSGKQVEVATFKVGYFAPRLKAAGRFHE